MIVVISTGAIWCLFLLTIPPTRKNGYVAVFHLWKAGYMEGFPPFYSQNTPMDLFMADHS